MVKKSRKNFGEHIDRAEILAYNRSMDIKVKWILRAILTALCAFMVGFILYNSLQTAEESAAQSSTVVEVVQQTVAVIAPQSPIATATGDAYDRLHSAVRTLAHFSEYALLGALGGWCLRSYTDKKKWLGVPFGALIVLGTVDEWLQTFAEGRGAQVVDVLVDVAGGACGLGFAVFSVWLVVKLVHARAKE